MKKLLPALLAGALLLSGCGGTPAPPGAPGTPAAETAAPVRTGTPAPTPDVRTPPASTRPPQAETTPRASAAPSAAPAPAASAPAKSAPPASAPPAAGEQAPPPPTAAPYGQKTADTALIVTGGGVERDWYFTLAELQGLSGGLVEEDYFSRGKDPQELTNRFKGVRVDYLLDAVVSLDEGAKKAVFTASDGYAAAFSLRQIRGAYLDETDPDKSLSMILAWEEDGTPTGLRLVMGQVTQGDYNRTNWVRDVVQIEVEAG